MINAYMNDEITLKAATIDQWGGATYEETTVHGRFEFKTRLVRNIQGEQVVSTAVVFMANRTLTHLDKIVYEGREYSILNIAQMKDFSSKYLKVELA